MDNFKELRDKFRRGAATLDEKEAYFDLLETRSHDFLDDEEWRAEWSTQAEALLSEGDLVLREQIRERLLSDFKLEHAAPTEADVEREVKRRKQAGKPVKAVWLVVASIILVCVLAAVVLSTDRELGELPHTVPPLEGEGKIVRSTVEPVDQQRHMVLPDGSTVLLNKGTEISYEDDFSSGSREVILYHGEAFFDVVHDPAKPFRVKTKNVTTTVLGTSFLIKTAGQEVFVTVLRGKVRVEDGRRNFGELRANQQMVVNTEESKAYYPNMDQAEKMFWEEEYLFVGQVTFGEAVSRLSSLFNVEIQVTNPAINKCIIHTSIFRREELMDILTVLSRTMNASVSRDGDRITIRGGECRIAD